ncbi:MAG: hypothetical protein CMK89_10035 [Pseudomonadales bacterium]|nr:hypothetical protein [Pseudomonadales bacterium]
MKSLGLWKTIFACAGCVASFASAHVVAADTDFLNIELTEEQSRLLSGYHQPSQANYNIHSLSHQGMAIPLVSFKFTADTNPMKGNSLELGAKYNAWSIDPLSANIDVTSVGTTFTVQAPIQKAMDFSKAIREKVELCPEKMIDKLVIDGAVGFNYNW